MSNRWANYNGKGKPITPEQLKELLRPFGHQPRYEMQADGTVQEVWYREDFEPAWRHFLVRCQH